MITPPPADSVCDDCDQPLGADYQERIVGMIGEIEIVELVCYDCKRKEEV